MDKLPLTVVVVAVPENVTLNEFEVWKAFKPFDETVDIVAVMEAALGHIVHEVLPVLTELLIFVCEGVKTPSLPLILKRSEAFNVKLPDVWQVLLLAVIVVGAPVLPANSTLKVKSLKIFPGLVALMTQEAVPELVLLLLVVPHITVQLTVVIGVPFDAFSVPETAKLVICNKGSLTLTTEKVASAMFMPLKVFDPPNPLANLKPYSVFVVIAGTDI